MISYICSLLKVTGTMSRMCGPARAMHTARIMFSDLYVTKRSGFQRLQGDRVDSTVVVGWRAR